MVENSTHTNSSSLRQRLIKAGLKLEKCEICGHTESLELHHKNGDHTDNRLDNLQILCANCHYKTDTFRGRGKGKCTHKPASELFLTEEEAEIRKEQKKAKKRIPEELKKVKKLELKICPICGKEFRPRKATQKYCCQNCYQGRNTNRPDIITLIKAFKDYKSFTQVAKNFGVTDTAVQKWCKLYKLPIHITEIQDKIKELISILS